MFAKNANRNIPVVFISSTLEDLKPYREAARKAAVETRFHPEMQEDFEASGRYPPLQECLWRVSGVDVVVVILAHRYGWVPPDQPGADCKSMTWLECERAAATGKEVLAFLLDKEVKWPAELKESYRSAAASEEGTATPELIAEVQRKVAKLKEFKGWLEGGTIRGTFTNPDDLHGKVLLALYRWRERHKEWGPSGPPPPSDPQPYLRWLRDQTSKIDIRGLGVGSGKAYSFPIEDLYIQLTMAEEAREAQAARAEFARHQPVALQDALVHRRLVIVGDPGSGKTTFLRRICFALADAAQKEAGGSRTDNTVAAARFLDRLLSLLRGESLKERTTSTPFPVLIRIAELAQHVRQCGTLRDYPGPTSEAAPTWLVDFLNRRSEEMNWGLEQEFFARKLEQGSAILLLDGLDEAPDRIERERMARLFENATQAYQRCRFVVTTRPKAYEGQSLLQDFHEARIEPLAPGAIETFLEHWSRGVYPDSPQMAKSHQAELSEALRASLEIRNMARNPVMLTALAVLHWNDKRLPEQRADLYDSILIWLSRSREKRPGREPAERCLALLQELALAMQLHPEGRQVRVATGWAAKTLAVEFAVVPERERLQRALDFLEQETTDSGIIVSRGGQLQFWHLIFQEYLAAQAIAGRSERVQYDLLLKDETIYRAEWREVALLLAGILRVKQGKAKADGLVSAMLGRLGDKATLAQQARCAGLVGAIVRDLRPLGYEPADPRYKSTLESVEGIFDARKAATVEFSVRLEAAEALGQAGDPRLHKDNWVNIDASKFWMGAQKEDPSGTNYDPKAYDNESPVHEVYLEAYQIGRYPVTVEQYRRFVEDENGYGSERWWAAGGFGETKGPDGWDDQVLHPNRPVVNVSWYEAAAYCAWAGVRLPTEAEWERAARGTSGRKYPWGDEEPDSERANYSEGMVGHATPVGLYPRGATPEGIEDMGGNVWEWVTDWHGEDYYAQSPRESPKGPASGTYRVLRGGAWDFNPWDLRAAVRNRTVPENRNNLIGFRCVREGSA